MVTQMAAVAAVVATRAGRQALVLAQAAAQA